MCGRSAKPAVYPRLSAYTFALALALSVPLLSPLCAQAKNHTFDTGIPLGLSLEGGVAQNPDTDLITPPQETSTSYSHFVGFAPFLDFGNFVLRFSAQLHYPPIVSGRGADTSGSFDETSDTGTFVYGGQLLLAPYVSEDRTKRAYIKLGLSQAILTGKNVRTYANGQVYDEKFEGRTREMLVGVGYELFIVQNYSLMADVGYRQQEFENLELVSGTTLSGAARNKGDPLLTSGGARKKFNASGAYFSLGLNFHF